MFQDISTQWGYNREQNTEKNPCSYEVHILLGVGGSNTVAISQLRLFKILVKIKNNKNAVHFSN